MEEISVGNKLGKAKIEVGKGLETKINLIVGANNIKQVETEKRKIQEAVKLGVHTVIDLSAIRVNPPLWVYGRENFPQTAFGKVAPILVALENNGEVTPQRLWEEIKWSVELGVDYMTLNLIPMKLRDFEVVRDRAFPTTSRQGGVLLNYMMKNSVDNPYGPILKDILALFKEYNVTMHIGSTFRPSGITEAYDKAHIWELEQQMEMFRRVDGGGVQAIVEPMSHQPLKDIGPGIQKLREDYGEYVPFQMLGPIVTEVNFNCDQYATASGAAMAAMHNVGKITTIPPREHVGFPTLKDTIEGIKATLTSVHAGDLCRLPHLLQKDKEITQERGKRKSCNPKSKIAGCNKCLDLCPLLVGAGNGGINRLRRYIGKEIDIGVHIDEAIWDYGECEHNEYDVQYKIVLRDVDHEGITGIMSEDKPWRRKGEQIKQPFEIRSEPQISGWDGGTIKTVTLVKHLDEVLYSK